MPLEYVTENRNGFVFPSSIPHRRGNRGYGAMLSVVFLIVTGCWRIREQNWNVLSFICYTVVFVSFSILIFALLEITKNLCLLFEEFKHINSRYHNSWIQLSKNLFGSSAHQYILTIVSIIGLIFSYWYSHKNAIQILFNENNYLGVFFAMYLFKNVLRFKQSPVNTEYDIVNLGGLDCGSGMAHSFFHGYLRIILPNNGLQNYGGLREFQQDYEARNGIRFAAYKLFILMPFSQHCPPRVDNEFSPSVSASTELEALEIDRAGVSNRRYKNSVYKIENRNHQLRYVTAEYATPLKTFYEVMRQNTPCANLYKQHREELLYNFYTTLIGLLRDDPDCRDLCEVIYYNDMDEQQRPYDVGGVILKRLQEIERRR